MLDANTMYTEKTLTTIDRLRVAVRYYPDSSLSNYVVDGELVKGHPKRLHGHVYLRMLHTGESYCFTEAEFDTLTQKADERSTH